jgi:hypothetical protein
MRRWLSRPAVVLTVACVQVSWEKSSIQEHLESHFIELDSYARLYVHPLSKLQKPRPVQGFSFCPFLICKIS